MGGPCFVGSWRLHFRSFRGKPTGKPHFVCVELRAANVRAKLAAASAMRPRIFCFSGYVSAAFVLAMATQEFRRGPSESGLLYLGTDCASGVAYFDRKTVSVRQSEHRILCVRIARGHSGRDSSTGPLPDLVTWNASLIWCPHVPVAFWS